MKNIDIERVQNLYNSGAYAENTSNWEDSTGLQRAKALISALKGNVSNISTVLDIGCGSGGVLRQISASAPEQSDIFSDDLRLLGCDASCQAILLAKRSASDITNIEYREALAEDLNQTSQSFDLVLLIHVLEHVPDMLKLIHEASKMAKLIYINVPIEATPLYSLRPGVFASQFRRFGHIHFFDEAFFREFLEANNYKVLHSGYSYDYLGQSLSAARMILRPMRSFASLVFGPSFSNALFGGISSTFLVQAP